MRPVPCGRALLRALSLFFVAAAAAFAGETALRIPRVARAPQLEDFISGRPREAEAVISEFFQREPGDGVPASQATTAYLSYDEHNFYVAFVCKDDPKLIRARMVKRDRIFTDDRVTFGLDTFHDHRRAYWFDVNPYNIQGDGIVTDGVDDSADWDAAWHSEARITADGYYVLFAIPFNILRFPNEARQTWGCFFGRIIGRNNETSLWPHMSRRRPGWVEQSADLEGLENLSVGRNVQIIPYGFLSRARYWDKDRYRSDTEPRAGLDAKMVLKDAFTLDLALNPDFSQVESDEPQVTVNQRYEVTYPDKRPFFLDNAALFKLPQELFFSRRIVDPQFGLRLTGKWGGWSMGVLGTDDRAPGAMLEASDRDFEQRTLAGVFRIQREFSDTSTIGILATSRDFGREHNRVGGLDARIRVLPNWFLSGQAATSETRTRDGARMTGPAYRLEFSHDGRHLVSSTAYSDVSPTFRAELGLIPRVDIRELEHRTGYVWRPEARSLKSWGFEVEVEGNWNRLGRLQDWELTPALTFEWERQTFLNVGHSEIFELYAGRGFRRQSRDISASTQWLSWLNLNTLWTTGTSIVYYPAAGRESTLGNSIYGSSGFTLVPRAQLRMENSYIYSSLRTRSQSDAADAGIFVNHIVRSKTNYQFNPALSLRTILDYNAVLPNPSFVDMERTRHMGVDVLLTYMLHPGTALHVGYMDQYDNLAFDPLLSPALQRTAFPDFSTGRQVFVKLSYLFNL